MTRTQTLINNTFLYLNPSFDFPLKHLTYFKIGGPAEVFLDLHLRKEIIDVVRFCQKENISVTVLGGASNVVVDDHGMSGVVIQTSNEEYQVMEKNAALNVQRIRVGVGMKTGLFVRKVIDEGLTGLEYFLGVPGKVGGAIFNNAHYLTKRIGKYVDRVEVLQPTGQLQWLSQSECAFGYDVTRFHTSKEIILQAELVLPFGSKESSMEMIKEATLYRAKTQPLGDASSGCYFQNTPNSAALREKFPQFADRSEFPTAFLIDQAGLKGERCGGIEVSQKHAAFLINTGNGSSEQVKELVKKIKMRVQEEFGVKLEEEVFRLG